MPRDNPGDSQPDTPPSRPGARERGRMRRRLRDQRRVREALLLDLGALVFELHRHGRREPELLQAKASELSQVDAEVRGLTEALDADLGVVELVAAGIAGTCQNCGGLLSMDTRFCPACGGATKPGLEHRRAQAPQLPVEQVEAPAEPVEQPTEESERSEDHEPEAAEEEPEPVFAEEAYAEDFAKEETFDEEPELAEEVESEPEPEPEPEPDPEPQPEQATAPWLQGTADKGEDEAAPQPVKVKRKMSRLERTLRGKRSDDS